MPVRQALPGGDLVAETAPRGRSDQAMSMLPLESLWPFCAIQRAHWHLSFNHFGGPPGGPHRRSSFAQMPGLVQGRCPWPSSRGPLSQVVPSVALFLWDYAPLFFEPGPQPEAGPHSESESEAGEPSSHHDGATAPLRCHMPLTT